MKPFHTVAVPHRDMLEGRLTMGHFQSRPLAGQVQARAGRYDDKLLEAFRQAGIELKKSQDA